MLGRASSSQLQNRPTTAQNQVHQWLWWWLCDNVFKKGLKNLSTAAVRGMRICERNNPEDPKVSEEQVKAGVPGARAEIPLPSAEKTMVMQAVLKQPMEDPTPQQEEMPWRKLQPVEQSPCWNSFSGRNCGLLRTLAGADHSWGTAYHREYPCWCRSRRTVAHEKDWCWRS